MSISLEKNKKISYSQIRKGFEFISIILNWNRRYTFGKEFDLDISCFLLNGDNYISDENDFIFYNNPSSSCGSVLHCGDNVIGCDGNNGDEVINIDFPKLREEIRKVVIAVTIHNSDRDRHYFGIIKEASVNIINRANNKQLAFFALSEAFVYESAVIICEFYRDDGEWKLKTLDEQHADNLSAIAKKYGVCID